MKSMAKIVKKIKDFEKIFQGLSPSFYSCAADISD